MRIKIIYVEMKMEMKIGKMEKDDVQDCEEEVNLQ